MGNLLTIGDFIDLYFLFKRKGIRFLISKFGLTNSEKVKSKWNTTSLGQSDFWNIPAVARRWNKIISGSESIGLHQYVYEKYLKEHTAIRMLSVGCGEGYHERQFASEPNFELIEGIDISQHRINDAIAKSRNFINLKYYNTSLDDFESSGQYDVILFHSSLHHFSDVDNTLKEMIYPILKTNGLLIINEYCGKNRLEIDKVTLLEINRILKTIPDKYRTRLLSNRLKKKVYSPGNLRMKLNDPSEAIDSESILPSLHAHFNVIEEKKLGWNILMPLLKDIAHNFYDDDEQANRILLKLFEAEDEFIGRIGKTDAIFGVYSK